MARKPVEAIQCDLPRVRFLLYHHSMLRFLSDKLRKAPASPHPAHLPLRQWRPRTGFSSRKSLVTSS